MQQVTYDLKKVNVQARLNELIRFFIPEAIKKGLKLTLENEVQNIVAVISSGKELEVALWNRVAQGTLNHCSP